MIMKKILYLIGLSFLIFTLSSCNDECPSLLQEGTLKVVFSNPDYDDTPVIVVYTLDSMEEIMEVEVTNHKEVQFNLNIGNYKIQPISYKHRYLLKNVQIQQGKTTTITYN